MPAKTAELSEKQKKELDWYWSGLKRTCSDSDGQVSAGQVAKMMGVSRATAKKYLDWLVKLGFARVVSYKHKTGVRAFAYFAD